MEEEKLYTVREIAEKFGLPYAYVATVSYRNHFKHFFEKRNVEKLREYPNGKSYPYISIKKVLKPEYTEQFFRKMETVKAEKEYGNAPKLNKTDVPEVHSWTHSAIQCYSARGNCEFCSNWQLICGKVAQTFADNKPPMRKTMIKLCAKLGKPPLSLVELIEEIA